MKFEREIPILGICAIKQCTYLLICKYSLFYEGTTCRALGTGIAEYKSRIKKKVLEAPLVHFVETQHNVNDFKFVAIDKCSPSKFNRINDDKDLL